jgi:Clp protease
VPWRRPIPDQIARTPGSAVAVEDISEDGCSNSATHRQASHQVDCPKFADVRGRSKPDTTHLFEVDGLPQIEHGCTVGSTYTASPRSPRPISATRADPTSGRSAERPRRARLGLGRIRWSVVVSAVVARFGLGAVVATARLTSVEQRTGQSVEQTTDFDRDRWFTAAEAVAYGLADEVIGGLAGAPESGTPA